MSQVHIDRAKAWKQIQRIKSQVHNSGHRAGGIAGFIDDRGDIVFFADDASRVVASMQKRTAELAALPYESLTGSERKVLDKISKRTKTEMVGGIVQLKTWHEDWNDFLEALIAVGEHFYVMPWDQSEGEKQVINGDL